MILCLCEAVTERQLRDAVRGGASTVSRLARQTRAGTGCGACACDLKRVLREEQCKIVDRDALPLAAK